MLLDAFRRLPAEAGDEISALVRRIAESSSGTSISWSDEWSDEDLRDFTSAAVDRMDDPDPA